MTLILKYFFLSMILMIFFEKFFGSDLFENMFWRLLPFINQSMFPDIHQWRRIFLNVCVKYILNMCYHVIYKILFFILTIFSHTIRVFTQNWSSRVSSRRSHAIERLCSWVRATVLSPLRIRAAYAVTKRTCRPRSGLRCLITVIKRFFCYDLSC